MKKKLFTLTAVVLIALLCTFVLGACNKKDKNDKEYWFSSYERKFVSYNDGADNISEAGTYWDMTVKADCTITISVRINVDAYSAVALYVNGDLKTSASDTGIYNVVYKDLELRKDAKLKLHAYWTNRAKTDGEGFEISVFSIADGTGDYPVDVI